MIVSVVLVALASAVIALWVICFMGSSAQVAVKIALEKIHLNSIDIAEKKQKILAARKKLAAADRIGRLLISLTYSEKGQLKEIKRLMKREESLKAGKLELFDLLPAMGYTAIDRLSIDSSSAPFFKKMVERNAAISGKATSVDRTRFQLASAISYALVGVGVLLALAALLMSIGMAKQGLMVGAIGSVLVVVLAYLPLDGLKEKADQRQDDITSEFPQAVSKLTLLVGAGIDMTQAWLQTAQSSDGPLYREMLAVIEEMQNGISPFEAYNSFIHRCNNKYTSKLGTSIMQNLSKGNDRICVLLSEISSESWNDRRQYAKRKGEIAQSKLLVPIMMMFLGIIVLVMAPVMGSFGGMGL